MSTGDRPSRTNENKATTLVQAILKDPTHAATELEADLKSGGDAKLISALLSAVESLVSLRGMDVGPQVAAIRRKLKKDGFLT